MFDAERDMVDYPASHIVVGLVGPGGMRVESVTPEDGTRVNIRFEGMNVSLDTVRNDLGLLFPARPIRPEVANDPTVAWLPEDRDTFYAEVQAAANGWTTYPGGDYVN
jgi:hypothetical protein